MPAAVIGRVGGDCIGRLRGSSSRSYVDWLASSSWLRHWDNPRLHWIATFFMLSGAIPFVLYLRLLHGQSDSLRDSQVFTLFTLLAVVVTLVAAWLVITGTHKAPDALLCAGSDWRKNTILGITGRPAD